MDEEPYRRLMYKQYLEVRDCKMGKGTFTTVIIPANTPIMEMSGPILLDREIKPEDMDMHLQIGPNTFLGPSGDVDDYINHSCDPNCKLHVVGNRVIVYSLYVIPKDAELFYDYSVTSTDTADDWKMDCKCGSNKCRKIISGHTSLDPLTKEMYKNKGMLPLYILEPQMIHKR
jgi:SET domain-containing protein